jgi:hypothetical protein
MGAITSGFTEMISRRWDCRQGEADIRSGGLYSSNRVVYNHNRNIKIKLKTTCVGDCFLNGSIV